MSTSLSTTIKEIQVWDPLVRLFHWTLVVSFTLAYATEDELQTLHVYAGYLIIGLVLVRLVWGVIGSRHARFSDFVRPPGEVLAYLQAIMRGSAVRHLGHNPAGGAMIILLIITLLLTSVTGIALFGVEGGGPLAGSFLAYGDALEEIHEFFANATLLLIILHIAGVILSALQHRENLVKSMITGLKQSGNEH